MIRARPTPPVEHQGPSVQIRWAFGDILVWPSLRAEIEGDPTTCTCPDPRSCGSPIPTGCRPGRERHYVPSLSRFDPRSS